MNPIQISTLLRDIFQDDPNLTAEVGSNIWYMRARETARTPFVVYSTTTSMPYADDDLGRGISCNWEETIAVEVWAQESEDALRIGGVITGIAHDMQKGLHKEIKFAEIEDRYPSVEMAPQPYPLFRYTVNIRIII